MRMLSVIFVISGMVCMLMFPALRKEMPGPYIPPVYLAGTVLEVGVCSGGRCGAVVLHEFGHTVSSTVNNPVIKGQIVYLKCKTYTSGCGTLWYTDKEFP